MDRPIVESAIKIFLREIGIRLAEAASVAKAAQVCADQGNVTKAVEIVLDVEQMTYEANNLLNSASTLNRIVPE